MTDPLYKDEAIIRSVTYSTNGGHKVTFEMDPEGWERFKGRETTRCMMVLVEIDNEGQPQPPAEKPKRRMNELTPTQQAGILCSEPRFQGWLIDHQGVFPLASGTAAEMAAMWVRKKCGVQSRTDISSTQTAFTIWEGIRNEYDAYCGRTASPD